MKPVLLAEGSLTRRRALSALLSARGFAVTALASLDEAYTVLKRMSGSATTLAAVVLGWPEYADGVAEDVFGLVHSDQYEHLPVLILADSNSPGAVNWRMTRPRTALLQWADYHEAPDALEQLVKPASTAAPGPAASDGTLRVMLVDDSATVRLAFGKLLEKNGYQVETAASVAEGRDKAKKAYFDIAIIDYFMPEANGPVLIAALKNDAHTSHILSATITGTYSDAVITESLAAGAVECLFKSEAKDLFLARLASLARTINDRKAIDNERRRLQGILGSVGDGVYGVDAEGMIAFVNPAAVDILGYAAGEDLIGCNAFETFHYAFEDGTSMPRSASFLVQCYANGSQVPAWQTVFWTASKRAVPVECTVYPMKIDGERTGSVVAFRDISARRMLEEELRWQAEHDSLTKLHNRAWFEAQLEQEVARLKRTEQASLLLFIDVDRFKYINDTAGHSAGDQLLLEVSMRLKSRLRASDHLARMGGDEYAVILRNVNVDDVSLLADGFRKALTQSPFSYGGKSYRITVSIGVAKLDQHTAGITEAMAHADIACHIAKNGGRNQTHLYTPETGARAAMDLDLGWSARLEEALKTDKFVLLFQPIVPLNGLEPNDIPTLPQGVSKEVGAAHGRDPKDSPVGSHSPETLGFAGSVSKEVGAAHGRDPKDSPETPQFRLTKDQAEGLTNILRSRNPDLGAGYEVLLRLKDHHNELISPSAFMPTAERFGLMADIDRWVIDRAFRALREVSRGERVVFAINLSAQSLGDTKLSAFVTDKLVQYNVDPTCVVFEVTESRAIDDLPRMQRLIHELRSLGCRIAVDDFGTGFSTFAYLRQLEADYLKIDGSLIHGLPDDPLDRAVVTALTSIAKAAGKKTVAECVEDPRALLALLECGVDFAQGHALGEPRRLLGAPLPQQVGHAVSGHTDNVVALVNRR